MLNFIYAKSVLACFEGEGDDAVKIAEKEAAEAKEQAEKKAAEARQAAETAEAAAAAATQTKFSQDDLNTFLAEDRRKHQEKYTRLETSYEEILADKNLAAEQRAKVETDLKELQKSFRTKEEQAAFEQEQQRDQYETELAKYKEDSVRWETKFKDSAIQRDLQDAAVAAEAFNPTQITALLRPMTAMKEETDDVTGKPSGDFKAMVDFVDVNDAGEREISLRTPVEAVQRMKQLPELYGNLFRANVVSGIGSGAAAEGGTGEAGKIDPTKLSGKQYRELREKNPAALGLRKRS